MSGMSLGKSRCLLGQEAGGGRQALQAKGFSKSKCKVLWKSMEKSGSYKIFEVKTQII